MDQKLYADLAAATKYYIIGNEFEERISTETQNINALSNYQDQSLSKKTEFHRLLYVCGVCAAIGGGIFLLLCAIVAMAGVRATATDMIAIPFIIAVVAVGIIVASINRSEEKRISNECAEKYEHLIKPQIEESKNNLESLKNNLDIFIIDNHHVVEFLPETYRNPQATSYMLLAVSNGRADTLKEAINLYEEQLHRWKLEEYARQSAEAQSYCALAMDELNSRQAQTNAHLQAIELMQFVNFITN